MKKSWLFIPILLLSTFSCSNKDPQPQPDPPEPTPTNTADVTWDLDNGTAPIIQTYTKGETPICPNTPSYKKGSDDYNIRYFTGWDKPIVPVVENVTYKAMYDPNEVRVATVVTLINLKPENHTFTFAYEGEAVCVDWGEGGELDYNISEHTCSHTFTFPNNQPISVIVAIYGKLTSFALSNENGVLANANKAVKNIVLAETITDVPDYAFNGLSSANSIMIDTNAKYVGVNAIKGFQSNTSIYFQNGFNESSLQKGWNPGNLHIVRNVARLMLHYDTNAKVFYGAISIEIKGYQYLALADFYPYDGQQKTFDTLTLPSSINGCKVNAIIYSAYGNSKYSFKKIIIPNSIIYIGNSAFSYARINEIEIPVSVEEIGEKAFYQSDAKTITFTGTNYKLTTINNEAFAYMLNLESINNFPSSVIKLGDGVFFNSPLLKAINNFGTCKITTIPSLTFGACGSLESITLPSTLTRISGFAFNTPSLKTIEATFINPNNIPVCEDHAFASRPAVTVNVGNFDSDEAAKEALTTNGNGWPNEFNYKVCA